MRAFLKKYSNGYDWHLKKSGTAILFFFFPLLLIWTGGMLFGFEHLENLHFSQKMGIFLIMIGSFLSDQYFLPPQKREDRG